MYCLYIMNFYIVTICIKKFEKYIKLNNNCFIKYYVLGVIEKCFTILFVIT